MFGFLCAENDSQKSPVQQSKGFELQDQVHVGAPHQTFTVVFDTGHGDSDLPSRDCFSIIRIN